ncbi:Lactadherin [Holothuria leucospilota]|uniref:Lactadherin n=1 Tax=Holothuria leucospilota TaxID=206669 RepID=A0A9Q1CKN9_HOLLE|nr:Lactadherin [Holothuria leucospilota]
MTASSYYSVYHLPDHARLHYEYYWRPEDSDVSPWLQVCFDTRMVITGILMQGSGSADHGWVEYFSVGYSADGIHWWFMRDHTSDNHPKLIFRANGEHKCVKPVTFPSTIRAKCLRIYPTKMSKVIGLRIDIIGCQDNDCDKVLGLSTGLIPDTSFSASSSDSLGIHSPHMARVSPYHDIGAGWVPLVSSPQAWIQIFLGNSDRNTLQVNYLATSFTASKIKVTPVTWYNRICLRLEFIGCIHRVCTRRLGMETREIGNDQVKPSSSSDKMKSTSGRLHYETWETPERRKACWGPRGLSVPDEYIQIDLLEPHTITGIITQGSGDHWHYHWVTSYRVDFNSTLEDKFHTYLDRDGQDKIFSGNNDQSTEVFHELDRPFVTNVVRIKPYTWYNVTPCMRVEVVGCPYEEVGDVCDMKGTLQYKGFCLGSVQNQSNNACRDIFSESSSLLTIKSDALFEFVQKWSRHFQIPHQQLYRIGLESVYNINVTNITLSHNSPPEFQWTDGTPLTLNYFRTAIDNLAPNRHYCVQMLLFDDLWWSTYECQSASHTRASICQRDIDECIGRNNVCSHTCINTPGGFYCSCPRGMILGPNLTHCIDSCDIILNEQIDVSVLTDYSTPSCYFVYNNDADYFTANQACAEIGSKLISLEDVLLFQNISEGREIISWVAEPERLQLQYNGSVCSVVGLGEDNRVRQEEVSCTQNETYICKNGMIGDISSFRRITQVDTFQ